MPRQIQKGDSWFQTQVTELAAVFVALDFEFWDKEAACDLRKEGGVRRTTWFFCLKDVRDELSAQDVYKAWKKAETYCEENPICRIGAAISAVKNLRIMNEGIKKSPALVGYKLGKNTMWVTEDSDKEKKLKASSRAKQL
jgi:hypothetical protein